MSWTNNHKRQLWGRHCNTSTYLSTKLGSRERVALPVRRRGMGLRGAEDRRHAQFLGGLVQSIPILVDRQDASGNTLAGHLPLPCLTNMLGAGSFDHPMTSPWERLLAGGGRLGRVGGGLQHAWTHLQHQYQDVAAAGDIAPLLGQPVEQAGFHADGSRPNSATDAVTRELEGARARHLGRRVSAMPREEYEKWA